MAGQPNGKPNRKRDCFRVAMVPGRSLMLTHLCSYRLTHGMRNSFVFDEEEGIAG
jgi:hypothetical protein